MSIKTFADRVAEDRRLCILRILVEDSPISESMVALALRKADFITSSDFVRIDFAWLEAAGLITTEEIAKLKIATPTQRGTETALGILYTPGVSKPED